MDNCAPCVSFRKERKPDRPRTAQKMKLVETEMCETMEKRLRERFLREA